MSATTATLTSFWPTAAPHTYQAPYVPTSILSTNPPHPPSPATLTALDAASSPLLTLRTPQGWPDPSPAFTARVQTQAQLAWNEDGLHAVYRITGPFKLAADDPAVKESRMGDSRVEVSTPAASAHLSATCCPSLSTDCLPALLLLTAVVRVPHLASERVPRVRAQQRRPCA